MLEDPGWLYRTYGEADVIAERASATGARIHAASATHGSPIRRTAGSRERGQAAIHCVRFAGWAFEVAVSLGHSPNLFVAAAAAFALVLVDGHCSSILTGGSFPRDKGAVFSHARPHRPALHRLPKPRIQINPGAASSTRNEP